MDLCRQAVNFLNMVPYNPVTPKLISKILSYVKDGPIKTRLGYYIDFKRTGRFSTSIRKSVISGYYERDYLKMIGKLINLNDYVVDVGAHEGYVSIFMAKSCGKAGKVYVVEPNPENLKNLHNNVKINKISNIEVIEKAIGNSKSKMSFYCSPDGGANGSLIKFSHFPETKIEVEVDALDNVLNSIKRLDLLKVDTEGNELNVFLGASQILSRHKPHICFEVSLTFWSYLKDSVDSLFDVLKDQGYELFVLKTGQLHEYKWLDERILNMFAVHSSKKQELIGKGVIKI